MSTTPTAERTKCPLCVHVSTVYDGVGRCPAHGTFRATPPPSAAVPDPADVEKVARAAAHHGVLYTLARGSACRCGWFGRDYVRHLEHNISAALAAVRPSPDSEAVTRTSACGECTADPAACLAARVKCCPDCTHTAADMSPVAVAAVRRVQDECRVVEREQGWTPEWVKLVRAALGTGDREGQ